MVNQQKIKMEKNCKMGCEVSDEPRPPFTFFRLLLRVARHSTPSTPGYLRPSLHFSSPFRRPRTGHKREIPPYGAQVDPHTPAACAQFNKCPLTPPSTMVRSPLSILAAEYTQRQPDHPRDPAHTQHKPCAALLKSPSSRSDAQVNSPTS